MTTASTLPVRCRAVAIIVVRGRGDEARVLLLRRNKGVFSGEWCLVSGRIEADEPAWRAAVREVTEEAGFVPDRLFTADCCDAFYNVVDETIEMLPFFVAEVGIDAQVILNHENSDYRWTTFAEAADLVPFVGHRRALDDVHRVFVAGRPPSWMLIHEEPVEAR